jgi:hypothetical protein
MIVERYECIADASATALRDLTLMKITVVRFMGTGGFLITYTKYTSLIKEVSQLYFNKVIN